MFVKSVILLLDHCLYYTMKLYKNKTQYSWTYTPWLRPLVYKDHFVSIEKVVFYKWAMVCTNQLKFNQRNNYNYVELCKKNSDDPSKKNVLIQPNGFQTHDINKCPLIYLIGLISITVYKGIYCTEPRPLIHTIVCQSIANLGSRETKIWIWPTEADYKPTTLNEPTCI